MQGKKLHGRLPSCPQDLHRSSLALLQGVSPLRGFMVPRRDPAQGLERNPKASESVASSAPPPRVLAPEPNPGWRGPALASREACLGPCLSGLSFPPAVPASSSKGKS